MEQRVMLFAKEYNSLKVITLFYNLLFNQRLSGMETCYKFLEYKMDRWRYCYLDVD
ncbi:MAG: hypothetical protein LBO69_00405 [Ignavibacteria bacterium]|nr:hypothetical protein [Ignavibacteria bacterium]